MQSSLSQIAKKYGLELIILFGSHAEGRARPDSDLDLGVFHSKPFPLRQELQLRSDLSQHFNQSIDLVFLKKAPPLLLGQIARHGKRLYGSPKRFKAFIVYAMQRFIDFKPYFELQEKALHRRLTQLHAR